MIFEVLQLGIGLVSALFLPGFLIVLLFFNELRPIEKVVYAIMFSVMLDIGIAIFLGYNEAWALRTGGLRFSTIATAQMLILSVLVLALLCKTYWWWIKDALKGKTNIYKKIKNVDYRGYYERIVRKFSKK